MEIRVTGLRLPQKRWMGETVSIDDYSEAHLEKQEKRNHCDLVLEGKIHRFLCLDLRQMAVSLIVAT